MKKPGILSFYRNGIAVLKMNNESVFYQPTEMRTDTPLKQFLDYVNLAPIAAIHPSDHNEPLEETDLEILFGEYGFDTIILEVDFIYGNQNNQCAMLAELDGFDQFPVVATIDRTGKYWILASFENETGPVFNIEAILVRGAGETIEQKLPWLLAGLFFKYYKNLTSTTLSIPVDTDMLNLLQIIEGVPPEITEKARAWIRDYLKSGEGLINPSKN